MSRRITILGSAGSIGRSALEVVRHYPDRFEVAGLATRSNVDLLARQITEFQPKAVAVVEEDAAERLRATGPACEVWSGPEAVARLAGESADVVLCAIVGSAGLRPLMAALDAGNTVALANKEPLVMAGGLVMEHARNKGAAILPVDSEHNAIFQCLQGHRIEDVQCVHLTASGGPFYGRPREALGEVTPEQAVSHPTWDMGAKVSVDSSTLMNKGFEVIEARWLFGLPLDKIEVVIHRQSIVHSLVEFTDGSILAHLGVTDMRFPILFALTWPERVQFPMDRLDLAAMRELTFAAPDLTEFPCLSLALEAARRGGSAPVALNAADEVAVQAFREGRIGFLEIEAVIRDVLGDCPVVDVDTLEAVEAMHAKATEAAWNTVQRMEQAGTAR